METICPHRTGNANFNGELEIKSLDFHFLWVYSIEEAAFFWHEGEIFQMNTYWYRMSAAHTSTQTQLITVVIQEHPESPAKLIEKHQ